MAVVLRKGSVSARLTRLKMYSNTACSSFSCAPCSSACPAQPSATAAVRSPAQARGWKRRERSRQSAQAASAQSPA